MAHRKGLKPPVFYKKRRFQPKNSGGGGIRTPGGYHPTTVFKTVTISHSDTPPKSIFHKALALKYSLGKQVKNTKCAVNCAGNNLSR